MYYRTGADFTFTPETAPQGSDSQGGQIGAVVDSSWIPPTSEFAQLPGVAAAARVGEFDMAINPDTSTQKHGRFLGIDRAEFASAAWIRTDFASESLGAMMNRLAPIPDSVLVSDELMKQQRLQVGDILTLKVDIEGVMSTRSEYVIVGAYHYFPTVYEDKITIIGNLDYLAMLTGLTPTHGIWMRLDPGADEAALQEDLASVTKVNAGNVQSASALIQEERNRLERIGIFGTLSVGFLATALMAILGLLVYSYASLQERAYRLAVLNAVGLSCRQILTQIVIEYAFLAIFGALAGALIGIFSAELFIPFFRYTGETGIPLPPLLPVVSGAPMRNLSLAFGLTIVVVEILSMTSIFRNRLTQIMKRVWM
jgi:putative ABC transport system permease protein